MVSDAVERLGGWEISSVNKVMAAMDHYSNAVFIGNQYSFK